ncbi:hypothetical protein [Yinghuangia soli]|uniref:Lipoprotein n=1 Tax=Yinghuangia soli TaxID=2908204 RepID=A0AA41U2E8_9ACTN|nr:hypothetical protein [Yinghuangia soli]MCF2530626.1 hypothetical protein [Yinghuangia soli]
MRLPSGRTALSALLTVPLLLAVAACSDSDGGRTAPDALDQKALEAALLTQAELPQGWELAGGGKDVEKDEIAQADRAACQPVMDLVSGRSAGIAPTAQVDVGLLGAGQEQGASHLGINQYKEGDAAALLAAATAALPGCTGFGIKQEGGGVSPAAVTTAPAPALGDAALYFELAVGAEGETITIPHTVVRKGSALVITTTMNVARAKSVPIPEPLIKAQVDKLAAAQQQ